MLQNVDEKINQAKDWVVESEPKWGRGMYIINVLCSKYDIPRSISNNLSADINLIPQSHISIPSGHVAPRICDGGMNAYQAPKECIMQVNDMNSIKIRGYFRRIDDSPRMHRWRKRISPFAEFLVKFTGCFYDAFGGLAVGLYSAEAFPNLRGKLGVLNHISTKFYIVGASSWGGCGKVAAYIVVVDGLRRVSMNTTALS